MKRINSPRLCLYDTQSSARNSVHTDMLLQWLNFNKFRTTAEYTRFNFPSQQWRINLWYIFSECLNLCVCRSFLSFWNIQHHSCVCVMYADVMKHIYVSQSVCRNLKNVCWHLRSYLGDSHSTQVSEEIHRHRCLEMCRWLSMYGGVSHSVSLKIYVGTSDCN
jgi:hypothetical protein